MKMTEAKIAEDYIKSGYNSERIKALAEINDCNVSDIKEILENQNVIKPEAKKPGRPKKTEEKIEVPKAVLQFVNTRIVQLVEVIDQTKRDLAVMEQELSELTRYNNKIEENNECSED